MEPNLPDVVLWSIPAFVLLTVIEMVSYRLHPDEDAAGYETKDAATSLTMGIGSLGFDLLWKIPILAIYMGVHELTPLRVPVLWWTVLLMLLAQDFFYYWSHRGHHVIRILWACHVVHHSSEKFNLTTALRQPWTSATVWPFYLPLIACGVHPAALAFCQSANLVYQFWVHTERVGKLPRPFEYVLNTPSHHRVHHASQGGYLDRNYGGILIVWDRMFGSFAAETERPVYGLTKNIATHNPLRVATHEYAAIARDIRAAGDLERAGRTGLPRAGLAAGAEGRSRGGGGGLRTRLRTRPGRRHRPRARRGHGLRRPGPGAHPVTATASRPGGTGRGGRAERFARPVLLAFLLAAAVDLAGLLAGADTVHLVAKPLLMPLLAGYAALRGGPRLLVAALLFGWGGDVFLLADNDLAFLVGMGSFAVGHVCYLTLFGRDRARAPLATGAGYVLVLVVFLTLIWPDLPADLRIPLTGYSLLLTAMAWRAGCARPVRGGRMGPSSCSPTPSSPPASPNGRRHPPPTSG